MTVRILIGDCRAVLPTLAAGSVQCCVTSPPYFGLRSYLDAGHADKAQEIGLEPTPDAYVAELVAVFREVRRVLADDGTLWLNIGDSYANGGRKTRDPGKSKLHRAYVGDAYSNGLRPSDPEGIKPKDLIGIPWMVAFALRADGWFLRSDVIWHKPNPMPEPVEDRPTSAHEHVFLFAKGQYRRRSVKLSDLSGNDRHLSGNTSLYSPDAWASRLSVGIATALLNCSQIKQHLRSVPLDSQIGQEQSSTLRSLCSLDLPTEQRMAAYAARILHSDCTAKEFLGEIHRLGADLRKRNFLLIGGCDVEVPLSPQIYGYGKRSIAVNDAGKVGEFDFCHGEIIAHTPTTCSYFYDAEAIKEEGAIPAGTKGAKGSAARFATPGVNSRPPEYKTYDGFRNARNVWKIATAPYSGAHFATMPPELAERCIKAGSKPGDTILDPFSGAGTTALVADRLGRHGIGIELNPGYSALAQNRVSNDSPLFAEVSCA